LDENNKEDDEEITGCYIGVQCPVNEVEQCDSEHIEEVQAIGFSEVLEDGTKRVKHGLNGRTTVVFDHPDFGIIGQHTHKAGKQYIDNDADNNAPINGNFASK